MLTLPDCSNESTPVEPVLEFRRSNVVIPIIDCMKFRIRTDELATF